MLSDNIEKLLIFSTQTNSQAQVKFWRIILLKKNLIQTEQAQEIELESWGLENPQLSLQSPSQTKDY